MGSTVTLSWFAVLVIVLVALAAGWILAKLRVGGNIRVQVAPGDQSAPARLNITRSSVRRLVLKCQCGAIWNFGGESSSSGDPPFPTGDSFVCPKCGKSIDLKLERQTEAELLGKLNLPNQS